MSTEQKEPVSGSNDDDKSLDSPCSSDIPSKTESSNDSKDFPDCALQKTNILIDKKGDQGDTDKMPKNIESVTNVSENTKSGTKNVGENSDNSFEFKETVAINIRESITNEDKQSSVSDNKTSDDDEEEMQLRWDDDDDEEQEKSLNEQETTKKETSDTIDAEKSSKSTVKELEDAKCESSKDIRDINIDEYHVDLEMNLITTEKDTNIISLEQKNVDIDEEASTAENKKSHTVDLETDLIASSIDNVKEIDSDNSPKKTETAVAEGIKSTSDMSECKQSNLNYVANSEKTATKNDISPTNTKSDIQLENSNQAMNIAMEVDNQSLLNKSDILSSTGSDSFLDASIEKVDHGLNKPDMMLEIPTQEIVEFSDEDSDYSDNTDKIGKRYSGGSVEENMNSPDIDSEVNTPNMDTSGIIDVDIECSSVNSEIMLKYDDTDQPLNETGNISTSDIGTSGIDVDMESTSVTSEIMLQYDDTDQPSNENEDLCKRTSENAGTKKPELVTVSSKISKTSNIISKLSEDMEVDITTPEKAIQKIQGVERNESKATSSSDTHDLGKKKIKDTITKLEEDITLLTARNPHLKLDPPSKIDLKLAQSSNSLAKPNRNLNTEGVIDNTIATIITKLDEDIENLTDEKEISDEIDMSVDYPTKTDDLNLGSKEGENLHDKVLKNTIAKLDEDIKNLTDEIEISDDLDQPSASENLTTDNLVDQTVVDTIITKLDEDIKNFTEEIEISDDIDISLDQPSKAKDLEVAQTSTSLAIEIEDTDDKIIKDTIAKLDEDIVNLTDEIEISDDLDITLDQPSKSKDLKVSQLSVLIAKENVEDKVIKDTIAQLDEDIKNLTEEIEISDDLDITLDQPSKTKDLKVTHHSTLLGEKNVEDKVIKDTIAELDEDIKNLTDEIEISDDMDISLDQPSKAKDLEVAQFSSSVAKDDENVDDKVIKDAIAKLDEDIKNLTDEIEVSDDLAQPRKRKGSQTDDNIDTNLARSTKTESLVEPSTSLSKETIPRSTNKSEDESLKDTITQLDEDIKNLTDEIEESGDLDAKSAQTKSDDLKLDLAQPSTSFAKDSVPIADKLDVQPSTSTASDQLAPDTEDEAAEMTDSLGLLAESSRVMEDDEEADEDDEGDDDDDFDQDDESSNQMTAEHSEDSNAQQSEPDSKDQDTPTAAKDEFNFDSSNSQSDKAPVLSEKIDTKVDDKPVLETTAGDDSELATVPKEKSPKLEENLEPSADIETVKLSDTSDNETEGEATKAVGILKSLLHGAKRQPKDKKSPSKTLKTALEPPDILNIVDLDESSSEGDVQEISKVSEALVQDKEQPSADGGEPDEADAKKTDTEVPKKSTVEVTPVIVSASTEASSKSKFDLEVFNLDSDEEDTPAASKQGLTTSTKALTALEMDKARESNKCINYSCNSGPEELYSIADPATVAYYDAGRKRKALVCQKCGDVVRERTQALMKGIKELTPLLNLDMKASSDLVEISDSESEEENDGDSENKERIGEVGAKFLEEQLADMINETWRKYKLDARLNDAQDDLNREMQLLEEESLKIDTLLNECQVATDKLRNELYATFEPGRKELPSVGLVESNGNVFVIPEQTSEIETRAKRRMTNASPAPPAKRPAIPLGYTPLTQDSQDSKSLDSIKLDDDKDISVVKLSMELAPSDLPPKGEISHPPLRVGMTVYAMRNTFCSWLKVKITEVHPKGNTPFTMCRVKFERVKVNSRVLPARCLAYAEPADVRLTIGTRVIALFKESTTDGSQPKESFYSGIVSEIPNPVNKFRYLIFFDDGYAQYVRHCDTRVVCECASLVWEEVHPFSRDFVRKYLLTYPERPMVRLHAGQSLKTEWNGKWWVSKVIQVDASLVQVHFEEDNRTEWIYRGSTRLAPLFLELQAAERQRSRPMPRSNQRRMNMPYVEYTRSDEQGKDTALQTAQAQQQHEDIRRQRAVAKKSTVPPMNQPPPPPQANAANLDSVTSRVVYYTPKNAVKPYKMVKHTCTQMCKRSDVLALKDLRTYNPLAKPLLSGWERQVVRFKGHKEVMYRAPCGRRLRTMRELHRYLQTIHSDMAVDLFDFHPSTHCLAEFVLNKCLVGKKDLSHGKENVPVPCVNYYDESLPEFCSYNTERTPTAGVPLNIDPDFLCGCDCENDCEDKSKCACWKMTLEGARTIGIDDTNVGYEYKRLPEPLPSGIYECNSRCKCRQTCLNRVAQHPLQLKLQVFKTYNRGWGIRALNDVPKGSFLCVYAGNLLTDATANLDGLNEGDEYLAELDYIEVVEQMKEGYEEDIPEADKKLDKMAQKKSSDEEETSSEEEEDNTKDDKTDDDFRPGFIGMGLTDFDKRLRKREKKERKNKTASDRGKESDEKKEDDDGCITISDDEEVREPSSFMAQTRMDANYVSKHRSVRSYFGKDEACYIMDAKVQGNIGRYLNHSCTPNVFVQNVFVDTHDPRFPWVAFFALSHIRAGTELTWNYNYDIGSVPGKVLYCYCGAPNCRGRLL